MEMGEGNEEVTVEREVLDELRLECVSERQDLKQNHHSATQRVKCCTRYSKYNCIHSWFNSNAESVPIQI